LDASAVIPLDKYPTAIQKTMALSQILFLGKPIVEAVCLLQIAPSSVISATPSAQAAKLKSELATMKNSALVCGGKGV
jgi:hypothetical protein